MAKEQCYPGVPGAENCEFPDLHGDEKLLYVFRRHWIIYFFTKIYFVAFILMTIALLVLGSLTELSPVFIYMAIVIVWLYGLQIIYLRWVNDELDIFLITDKRIIGYEQVGFLHRKISQASIDQIQEVNASMSGLLPNILHYGQINIQTASETTDLHLPMVSEAFKAARKISEFVDNHRHGLDERSEIRFAHSENDNSSNEDLSTHE